MAAEAPAPGYLGLHAADDSLLDGPDDNSGDGSSCRPEAPLFLRGTPVGPGYQIALASPPLS